MIAIRAIFITLVVSAGLALCAGREAAVSADVLRAQQEVDRVKRMVTMGALPRKALEESQAALVEAKDRELLQSTLYAKDGLNSITEEKSRDMMGAAERQVQRSRERLAAAKKKVDEGVAPLTSLTPYLEEFERNRVVYSQAVAHARLVHEMQEMIRAERELQSKIDMLTSVRPGAYRAAEKFDGNGSFTALHLRAIELGFVKQFRRILPISAKGDSEMHRGMGYDHRGRVDVAVLPDSTEGMWLRKQLELMRIPYIAFRGYVPGQATGAHIHIGPPSLPYRSVTAATGPTMVPGRPGF